MRLQFLRVVFRPRLVAKPRKERSHARVLGQMGGAIVRPFPRAATLFLLFPLNFAVHELLS
jgi:hypothetical protein